MKRAASPPATDSRGWRVGRFKIGDQVRAGDGFAHRAEVVDVLRWPRVTMYRVMYEAAELRAKYPTGDTYIESQLVPA